MKISVSDIHWLNNYIGKIQKYYNWRLSRLDNFYAVAIYGHQS